MRESETVLITGGEGFIGGYTAASLLDAGHEVVSFGLETESKVLSSLGISDDVETIQGDVTDTAAVFRAVRDSGATRIIHLAALLTETTRRNPPLAQRVNIGGTTNIFEAARVFADQIERVAWASSSAVYAPAEEYDESAVDEDDLVGPETLYGAAKVYNERQAEIYREDHDVSHVGLRPTLVYGPHRETGSATSFVRAIEGPALGEAIEVGPADHIFDWQYVADAGQAFHKAAFAPERDLDQRIFNVCGERATLREVVDVVSDVLDEPVDVVFEEGENPWNHYMDMSAANDQLGYDPEYDLEAGIREYTDVLRNES